MSRKKQLLRNARARQLRRAGKPVPKRKVLDVAVVDAVVSAIETERKDKPRAKNT